MKENNKRNETIENGKKIIIMYSDGDKDNCKRVCNKCKIEKDKEGFEMRNMTKDKKIQRNQPWCKDCR